MLYNGKWFTKRTLSGSAFFFVLFDFSEGIRSNLGTLNGCSQMAISVLTIQIKKRDKHLVYSPHCRSYSLAFQPHESALYTLLNYNILNT